MASSEIGVAKTVQQWPGGSAVAVRLTLKPDKTRFYCKTAKSAKTDSFTRKTPARVRLADTFSGNWDTGLGQNGEKVAQGGRSQ